jgi:hypothetical protein
LCGELFGADYQAKELDKLRKNKGKPLDGRPVPY